jgi:membrane protein
MFRRLKKAGQGFADDQAAQMGAALAYFTLFSLAPLLILGIAIVALIVGEAESKDHVVANVRAYVNDDIAEAVRLMLDNFHPTRLQVGVWTSVVGVVSLVFGATGMFTSLRSSLHRIWRLPTANDGFIRGYVKTYLLALLMIFVSVTFIVLLLLTTSAMPLLAIAWAEQFPDIPWSGPIVGLIASLILLTLLFVFTFRFMSDGKLRYRQLWGGAFVSAVLFSVGKVAIGTYLAYVGLASAFGAAGSVVVFLAWVYYSAQILFFGAEVIAAGMRRAVNENAF